MRGLSGLFDEFAAAFQFPLYFGENIDTFDECMSDLDWEPAVAGYVVLITEPDQVLADTEARELGRIVGAFASATREWARPIDRGEWWDRPAVPFHVVLACEKDIVGQASHVWARVGPDPIPLRAATA